MKREVRRIVTGTDPVGHAYFASDEVLNADQPENADSGFWPIWGLNEPAQFPVDGKTFDFQTLIPPVAGVRCLVYLLPPGTVPMHKSATVAFIVILEGEIWVELEGGVGERLLKSGDIIVQNGTSHALHNRSSQGCLLMSVLYGGHTDTPESVLRA